MNKNKEYNDKINKLESEKTKMINENVELVDQVDILSDKRQYTICLGVPFSMAICGLASIGTYLLTKNTVGTSVFAGLLGVSACALSAYDLILGLNVKKLNKKINNNDIEIDKKEDEIDYTKQLLDSYDKANSLNNEEKKENKTNFVHNNYFSNNKVDTKGKTRTLVHRKG